MDSNKNMSCGNCKGTMERRLKSELKEIKRGLKHLFYFLQKNSFFPVSCVIVFSLSTIYHLYNLRYHSKATSHSVRRGIIKRSIYDEDGQGNYPNEGDYNMGGYGLDAHWQNVEGIPNHKIIVYSAYYDVREDDSPVARVIAISRTKYPDKVNCRLYFENNEGHGDKGSNPMNTNAFKKDSNLSISVDVPGTTSFLGENNHQLFYHDCNILCPLNHFLIEQALYSKGNFVLDSLSITPHLTPFSLNGPKITNKLPVLNSRNGGTGTFPINKTDIGLCVKPIHSYYNNTLEMLEFVELNKLLGVSKFIIYNESISDEVGCLLNYYKEEENSVTIVPYHLPYKSEIQYIPNRGVLSALNDCIYRNMNDFHYLMQIDLDEFIIPHLQERIPDMLEYINYSKFAYADELSPRQEQAVRKDGKYLADQNLITSYNFQNAFFYLGFDDDKSRNRSTDDQLSSKLRVLRKTRRLTDFSPHGYRSKYIVVPNQIKKAGNHIIHEFFKGSELNVPSYIGTSQHYRGPCDEYEIIDKTQHLKLRDPSQNCTEDPSQVDRSVYRYEQRLVKNIKKVLHEISTRCTIDPKLSKLVL